MAHGRNSRNGAFSSENNDLRRPTRPVGPLCTGPKIRGAGPAVASEPSYQKQPRHIDVLPT